MTETIKAEALNAKVERDVDILPQLSTELESRHMLCLHGIALDDVGKNSLLPESTTLEERFRIAIEDVPTLSATIHTERAATSKAALWSNVGVLIGEGKLQAASTGDMSSVMLEGGERRTPEQTPEDIVSALDRIAESDAKYPNEPVHNEVVVKEPIITGLYFKDTSGLAPHQINGNQVTAEPNTVPDLISTLGTEFDLPVFAVRTTGMYEVTQFDKETGKYRFTADMMTRPNMSEILLRRQADAGALGHAALTNT